MKKFVKESLYENFQPEDVEDDDVILPEEDDDSDVEVVDTWEKPEEDEEEETPPDKIDVADMEDEEIEVEEIDDELADLIDTELEVKEFNRVKLEFKVIGRKNRPTEIVTGVPMAKLRDDNYIFKTPNGMRKFNLKDIVLVEETRRSGKKLNEIVKDGFDYNFTDYLFDIAGYLMLNPENVQALMDIHTADEEEAKIEITNEIEDNEPIYGAKGMFAAGIDPEDAANRILNQYQG